LMQSRAEEAGVRLGHHLDGDLPSAKFDPDAMHRAILNLVTNAIDATASGSSQDQGESVSDVDDKDANAEQGKVFVRTGYDLISGWMVDVIDNGPGVAQQDREKIFSLFESRKGMRGTGLGLPVSAKIMREHGGSIDVLDGEKGIGICFRLMLPPTVSSSSEMDSFDTFV